MRSRIFAVLAIAVLAGGGLAYGTYNFLQNQPAKPGTAPTQAVVVAAADLQLGAEIKMDDLTVAQFPAGKTPEGTFRSRRGDRRGLIVTIVKTSRFSGQLARGKTGSDASGDSRGHACGLGARQ